MCKKQCMCIRRAGKRIGLRVSQLTIMANFFTRRNLLMSLSMRWILLVELVIRRILLMNSRNYLEDEFFSS